MRDTILIVDDEELNRELLCQMFEGKYNLLTAADGREGIMLLGKHINEIAVILLDIVMPVVNGYQVLQVLHTKGIIDKIPVVLITAQDDDQTELQCYQLGATALISKPFKAQTVIRRVDDIINMHQNVENLQQQVKTQEDQLMEQQKRLEDFNERLLDVISNVVEFRDVESGEHIKRVKGLTKIMAKAYQILYPEENMTDDMINIISKASAMHDIGKISIPDHILLKPGRLTDDERMVMMSHTTKGCEILGMLASFQDEVQFKVAYDICRHHHERYDGKGYPDGLKGEEIPLSAQLVSVADVYDALVSDRVYKKAFDKETAYNMIVGGQCGQFSPKMMACFAKAKKAIEDLAESQSNNMMEGL